MLQFVGKRIFRKTGLTYVFLLVAGMQNVMVDFFLKKIYLLGLSQNNLLLSYSGQARRPRNPCNLGQALYLIGAPTSPTMP